MVVGPPGGDGRALSPGHAAVPDGDTPAPRATRIVVVTDDVLTARMAGPAIRAWHIARALGVDHDVVLATTSPWCEVDAPGFRAEAADAARFEELERWCDVAIVQGYVLHNVPSFRRSDKVMVFDLYDPLHLEALELTRRDAEPDRSFHVANTVATLEEQLVRGDYFVCASDAQRDFWLGFLASLGRVNPRTAGRDPTLRGLIDVVPFGLPDDPPVRTGPALRGVVPGIGADDEVVLWGGGLYDWFDPLTLIRAIDTVRVRRPRVRLCFLGMRHPKPDIVESAVAREARALAGELGLVGTHVFFNEGWVPYDERQNYLLDADIGVSLHHDTVETTFSFRTRILDYLWAGLPIVASAGDGFADLVAAEGLGAVVAADDVAAVAGALEHLLGDGAARRECRRRTAAVAAGLRWSVVLAPVVRFCAAARRAPDEPQWPGAPGALGAPGDLADDPGSHGAPGPGPAFARDLRRMRRLYREGGVRAVAVDARRWVRQRLADR